MAINESRINPAELYLIEHFSSLEYFEPMVKDWRAMVEYLEEMLDRFMHRLPPAYRRRHLSEQPDIVWGQRCIPNFRSTLHYLEGALEYIRAGRIGSIGVANNVNSDVRGQREYSSAWLNEVKPDGDDRYFELLFRASDRASNIATTSNAAWIYRLLPRFWRLEEFPPHLPEFWPTYQLDRNVFIPTGGPVPETGIYLPTQPETSPNLLIQGESADVARVGLNDQATQYNRKEPTVWTLVRRTSDTSSIRARLSGGEDSTSIDSARVEAGQPCPRSGWWLTPAKAGSRCHFKGGEVMPSLGSDYGLTIWQWDSDQSKPHL